MIRLVSVVVLTLLLTGCDFPKEPEPKFLERLNESEIKAVGGRIGTDGRVIEIRLEDGTRCVVFLHLEAGGIDCDWIGND